MQRVLFHSTVFGPIKSRRLGTSLGLNLTPDDGKICSFDCLYCEAGFNAQGPGTTGFAPRAKVAADLEARLKDMAEKGERLDVITFSGNGEPTLHPDFAAIVDDTIALRDRYVPEAAISVLSNSTRIADKSVVDALAKVDNNILKLDSAVTRTMRMIDRPQSPSFTSESVIAQLEPIGDGCIIQTMLLSGVTPDGEEFDNTTDAEVDALIDAYRRIGPREVMLYTIDRATPWGQLRRVDSATISRVADRVKAAGIRVQAVG